jgi:glycosyltransferase involved in cell wall biosynthesis
MKIAVWNDLRSGGGKRALYNHVKGLVERGHEVVSFCPDTADLNFMPLSQLVAERVFPLKDDMENGAKWIKRLHPRIHHKTRAMLAHCSACAAIINNEGFDVLFANSSTFSYMSHIGRFVKTPKLIYLGEPCRYLYEAKPEFLWKAPDAENVGPVKYVLKRAKHLIRMYWYSYMCREEYVSAKSYDLILVNSFFSRESVKRAYNLDSKVCYLGIDTDMFLYRQAEKGDYVIGMGYVQPSKGIEIAINSLALVKPEYRPSLIWVSNNNKKDEYIDHILNYAKLNDVNLIIKTLIPDAELLTLLSGARVFLYFPNLEPFGLAPLEANACGTAVISIAEGGPRESIKNGVNGYLVNDISYREIAERIGEFFTDKNLAAEMGRQSREYVLNNWNLKMGTDNIEHWLNILNNSRN